MFWNKWGKLMSRMQILLFSVFLSILIGSLIYYVFIPREFERPLRADTIPSDAYVVPWMRPNPSLEELKAMPGVNGSPWDIDSAMAGALKLSMTFRIFCQRGTLNEIRVVPITVYIGHDKIIFMSEESSAEWAETLKAILPTIQAQF